MTYNFNKCDSTKKDKLIVLEENKRKFIGHNPKEKEFIKVKIDGCLITNGIRCDFLLVKKETHSAYFVELKGKNIEKALSQLETTIKYVNDTSNNHISSTFYNKSAFAMLSQCPLPSSEIQNRKKEFLSKLKTKLFIKNQDLNYNFELEKEI